MRASVNVADQSISPAVAGGLTSTDAFREASRLHEARQFAAAETLLRDAIIRDPANFWLRNARGVMFAALGRHLDAVWCYRDALACDGAAVGVWTNLGNALTQLNHLRSAISCHRRAIAVVAWQRPVAPAERRSLPLLRLVIRDRSTMRLIISPSVLRSTRICPASSVRVRVPCWCSVSSTPNCRGV